MEFINELEKICEEKQFNEKIKNMLVRWFYWIFNSYNSTLNILDYDSLKEYIEKQLKDLKKVQKFNIYTIEEILKDSKNHFNNFIKPLPEKETFRYLFLLKKEKNSFQIAEDGNFFISCYGLTNFENLSMELIEHENIHKTFHHELRHINQGTIKYQYPSIYPFFSEIIKMCQEGEAVFHRRLIDGNIFLQKGDWNEEDIKEYPYDLFYQIYIILMFLLPTEMRKEWENEKFNISYISGDKQDFFVNIFALVTILVAKTNSKNTKDHIEASINLCYQDCVRIIDKAKQNEENQQIYTNALQENNNILSNLNLLKEEYKKFSREHNDKMSLETFKQSLEDWSIYYQYKQDYYKKKEYLEENKYQLYLFGINLSTALKSLLEQNLSVTDVFQIFVKEAENYLQKTNAPYLEDKLLFISTLKNPNYGFSPKK